MDLSRSLRTPWARVACLLIASRLALVCVGLLSTYLLPSGLAFQPGNLVAHEPAPRVLEMWARWDSEWFLLIAQDGYNVADRISGLGVAYEPSAAAGFLPLYPMMIRVLGALIGPVAAGVLISNFCLFISLVLLQRLLRLEIGGERGEEAGMAACAALLLFPSSLFLSAVYSESLFLMLTLAAFLALRRGRFWSAGIYGGLAALTRPFGLLLVIPFLWEWWSSWRQGPGAVGQRRPPIWSVASVGLIPAALGGFLLYCGQVFGDPLALLRRQERWRGGLSGPWRAFVRWWEAGPTAHGSHGSTFELVVAILFLVMLGFMVRRLRLSYTLYAAAGMTLALGSTLWSFSRLALTLFPFFMVIGVSWAEGRRCLPTVYAFVGASLSGLMMALFANWWWAG